MAFSVLACVAFFDDQQQWEWGKSESKGNQKYKEKEREKVNKIINESTIVRAITSARLKLCKMEKVVDFTQFEEKKTHISLCIVVHKCTIATVPVHICTGTVELPFNILMF